MKYRIHSACLALLLVPVLSACPGGYEEDGHEDEIGDSTDTAGTESTTTDESGDQGSESAETGMSETAETTTDTTDTADTTDTTDTTDTETTGNPDLTEELCTQACGLIADCVDEVPDCVVNCIDAHEGLDGECLGFEQALTSCIGALTCEELNQFFESDPVPYPCQAEEAQVCGGGECLVGVGQGEQPGECSFEYTCPDEPIYAVECTANGCTCLIDDVEVGGCSDSVELCAAVGELAPVNTCCDWTL